MSLSFLVVTVFVIGLHNIGFVSAQGKDVPFDEFVWFTAIRSLVDNRFRCSGSWLGSRYVLTAAHSFKRNLKVQIGYWCRYPDNCGRVQEEILVDGAFFHTSSFRVPGGDLAILVLRRAVRTIDANPAIPYLGPALDPWTKPLQRGRKLTVIGAGRSAVSEDDVSVTIKKLKVKYVGPGTCQQRVVRLNLESFEFCTKSQNGSPCPGDSGSALVVPGKGRWSGRDIILAVHNKGPAACSDRWENRTLVHFDMASAAYFVTKVVCSGDFLEDWCGAKSPPSLSPKVTSNPAITQVPTKAAEPTPVPGDRTSEPTLSSSSPTSSPPSLPTDTQTLEPPTVSPVLETPGPTPPVMKLSQSILHSFERHSGTVYSVSFNPDGSRLVSGGGGAGDLMNVWKPLVGGGAFPIFMDASSTIFAAEWNPLSNVVAAGSADGLVRLWNVDAPDEAPMELDKHKDAVRAVAWHSDGTMLVSGSYDCTVRIWNTTLETQLGVISTHTDHVRSVAFRPDGSQFASASDDKTIKLWSSSDPYNRIRTLRGHSKAVRDIAYSPNGEFLASASLDGSVRVWKVSNGVMIHEFLEASKVWMLCVAWSPDGKFIVSGSADALLRVWDAEKRGAAPLLVLEGHFNSVWSVEWSPDGMHIASGSTDEVVIVWKMEREFQPANDLSDLVQ